MRDTFTCIYHCTGSTNSTGSEGDVQCLQAGVCIKQSAVSNKDTNIAKEALELLVTCLQLRSQLLGKSHSQIFPESMCLSFSSINIQN